jgi:hypothetical protein
MNLIILKKRFLLLVIVATPSSEISNQFVKELIDLKSNIHFNCDINSYNNFSDKFHDIFKPLQQFDFHLLIGF